MHFITTVDASGRAATGLRVPDAVVEALGAGRHPPVRVTFGGHTYRSSVASVGGVFRVPVSAEVREITGAEAGDSVEVEIEVDTEPRSVVVPPDLAAALDLAVEARHRFDVLSYSRQLQQVLAVESARTPQTRERRIQGVIRKMLDAPSSG